MAMADGLTALGLDDPEVMAPPSVSGDWTGPYLGLSYGRTTATTETYREWLETKKGEAYNEASCTRRTPNGHDANKCVISDKMYLDLGGAANDMSNPWDQTGYKWNDGSLTNLGNPHYDGGGYKGIWLGDDSDGKHVWVLGKDVPVPTSEELADLAQKKGGAGAILDVTTKFKPDTVTKMSETVTSVTEMDDLGAFVGYRRDLGRIVLGAELGKNGDITSLEAQAGLDLGNVLVYGFGGVAQFDGIDGTVFGAGTDLKIRENIVVGVKHTIGEFDNTDTESTLLRVAIKF